MYRLPKLIEQEKELQIRSNELHKKVLSCQNIDERYDLILELNHVNVRLYTHRFKISQIKKDQPMLGDAFGDDTGNEEITL